MQVAVIGLGYVGLSAAACLADAGNVVIGIDKNSEKITALDEGVMPIYEPGLAQLISRNRQTHRLFFSSNLKQGINNYEVVLITVGTPVDKRGITDLSQVYDTVALIATMLDGYKLIVVKSTVPPGTCKKIKSMLTPKLKTYFDCVSNPEFLRQGSAVNDFQNPARIIIGSKKPKAIKIMKQLYKPFIRKGSRILIMDPISAELTKYAANAMLGARVSFMNELSVLCEKIGADIGHIRDGIGIDPRIGERFLSAGIGYGGSCLPKDIRALINIGDMYDCQMSLARAVEEINLQQQNRFIKKILDCFVSRPNTLAVWGLAFKAGTDDMRESPALYCIEKLVKRGVKITAHDPIAMEKANKMFGKKITIVDNKYDALDKADGLVILTDWQEFKEVDFNLVIKKLKGKTIFDGKNLFDPVYMEKLGIDYHCIGRNAREKFNPRFSI